MVAKGWTDNGALNDIVEGKKKESYKKGKNGKPNSKGEEVKLIQTALQKMKIEIGKDGIDGVFGNDGHNTVMTFQENYAPSHNTHQYDWSEPDGWVEGEKSKSFYGAVIILDYSHTAFLVGKNTKQNKYVFIGGNQSDEIRYGTVTIGKELGIFKPKNYEVPSENMKLKEMNRNEDGSYKLSR